MDTPEQDTRTKSNKQDHEQKTNNENKQHYQYKTQKPLQRIKEQRAHAQRTHDKHTIKQQDQEE